MIRCLPVVLFLPILWQSLVELVGEDFCLVFDSGLWSGFLLNIPLGCFVPLTVVDNDTGDLVTLPGVAFEALLVIGNSISFIRIGS